MAQDKENLQDRLPSWAVPEAILALRAKTGEKRPAQPQRDRKIVKRYTKSLALRALSRYDRGTIKRQEGYAKWHFLKIYNFSAPRPI